MNQSIVDEFLTDEWVDDQDRESVTQENLTRLLAQVTEPRELDEMVKGFNWDTESDTLKTVLSHPLTDPGTWLRAFWMSGPTWFMQYANEADIPNHEQRHWALTQWIQHNALSVINHPTEIMFDPRVPEHGVIWSKQHDRERLKAKSRGIQSFYQIPKMLFGVVITQNQ